MSITSPVHAWSRRTGSSAATRRAALTLPAAGSLAALAACSVAGGREPARLTTEELTLSYLTWDQARPDLLPTLTEVLQRYTVKHPNLRVEPVPHGGDPQRVKLTTAVAAGSPPDVADAHHAHVRDFGAAGTIQDIGKYLKRDPFPKEHVGWEPYEWRGKPYAAPWGLQSSCIFYNQTLFDRAGVPYPPANWTWQQFVDAAARLTTHGATDADTIWGAADYGGQNYQYISAFLLTYGGSLLNSAYTETTLTSGPSLEALDFRAGWASKLRITSPAGSAGGLSGPFRNGTVGMIILGSWNISNVKANQLGKDGRWDVAPLPKGPKRRAGLVHETGISMPTGVRHPEESWALLKYLTSPEGVVPFGRVGRTIPANRTTWEATLPPDGKPNRYREAILNVWDEIAMTPPFTPRSDDVTRFWRTELDPVWEGKRPPREGAEAFKRQMDQLLKEIG